MFKSEGFKLCRLHIILSNMVNTANLYKIEDVDKVYVHSIRILMRLPDQNWAKIENFEQHFDWLFLWRNCIVIKRLNVLTRLLTICFFKMFVEERRERPIGVPKLLKSWWLRDGSMIRVVESVRMCGSECWEQILFFAYYELKTCQKV